MKKIDNISDLLILHDIVEKSGLFQNIECYNGKIEIQLTGDISAVEIKLNEHQIDYEQSGNQIFEVEVDKKDILFFKDKPTFYDKVCLGNVELEGFNVFIWNCDESCLLYENFTKSPSSFERTKIGDFILNIVQYRDLLNVFLDTKNELIELDRVQHPQNELFFASKGDEKLLVKIVYKKIVEDIYNKEYEAINIGEFLENIKKNEWLACFKNTVCSFFDKQSDSKRSFFWLYENFAYLLANTGKSYELFLSKFSFDKVSKQFKKDREQYFNSLNDYQNKLSGQLISIPLTIGAALLSSNFVTNNELANSSVIYLISAYVIFVMGTIGFVFLDLIKLMKDIKEERDSFQKIYSNIYENFKRDFIYILRKSQCMIAFAIFLLLLFFSVLLILWFSHIDPLTIVITLFNLFFFLN